VICVTGAERTASELRRRIEAHADWLHEARLDALDAVDAETFDVIRDHGQRLLVCCRPARQTGDWRGDEGDRLSLLKRAQQLGARYLDVEADAPLDGFERQRVVLSWHDDSGLPADLRPRLRNMSAQGTAVVKLAASVTDATELGALLQARGEVAGEALLIGMGPAGRLSRTRYRTFGSAWTYVVPRGETPTAAGQLDLTQACALGLAAREHSPMLALVGGPQVMASPGPEVYARLLTAHGSSWSYEPVITRSLADMLPLLERFGARALSVTMPLKQEALTLATADDLSRRVGAANSLRRTGDGWQATNTDVQGVRGPLEAAVAAGAGSALILGAGGAARAALEACRRLRLEATVCARRPDAARGWARRVIPWAERGAQAADVLINATPITGADSPWPDDVPLPVTTVFDLAMSARSRLLERARAEQRETIGALEMWLHQGAAQMSWFLEEEVGVEELRGLLQRC